MMRPSIVLSDTSTIFSEKTFFNIYDRYELKAEIRNSLEDLKAIYDDLNNEILLNHTNLILKNINFQGKINSPHPYRNFSL